MSIPRLVDHPTIEGIVTPVLLLAQLRDIDPTLELVYFGARDWRLGSVRTGQARDFRAKKADRMLADLDRIKSTGQPINQKNYLLALLLKQGFAQIAKYVGADITGVVYDEAEGEHTTVLENFRRRHFNALNYSETIFETMLANANGEKEKAASQAKFQDALHNDVRAHFRREVKGRVTFGHGGMTGGPGRLFDSSGQYIPRGPILTGEALVDELASIMAELGGP